MRIHLIAIIMGQFFLHRFLLFKMFHFGSSIIKLYISISLNNHQHDSADSKSEPKSYPSFSIQIALNRAIHSISIIAFFALQSSVIIIILMPQRLMLLSIGWMDRVVFFSSSIRGCSVKGNHHIAHISTVKRMCILSK